MSPRATILTNNFNNLDTFTIDFWVDRVDIEIIKFLHFSPNRGSYPCMGFFIRNKAAKGRKWSVRFVTYTGGTSKTERALTDQELDRYGFYQELSIEQAKELATRLNAKDKIEQRDVKREIALRKINNKKSVYAAYLGEKDVIEFENDILYSDGYKKEKDMHWRTAQKLICDLKIDPRDWDIKRFKIFDYLVQKRYSLDYSRKILLAMNQWGHFKAHKYNTYFKPIEYPRGKHLVRIDEAFQDKIPGGRESQPLTFQHLLKKQSTIKPEWFDWLFIACAFGLRPSEVDQLHLPESTRTWFFEEAETVEGKKVQVLAVNQKKVRIYVGVHKSIKRIPIITKEQEQAVDMIKRGIFKRPSHPRHLQLHFGPKITLYGPRKNFSLWMRQLGQDQMQYSRWLGHSTVDRTEKSYEHKAVMQFNPIK